MARKLDQYGIGYEDTETPARVLDNRSPDTRNLSSLGAGEPITLDRGNQQNSYQIFNSAIQEMLRSAQKGLGTRQSQTAAIDLSNQQVQRGQAQATPGMNPSLQSSIRNADMNAINPSIQGANDQTQTMQERLTGFKDVLAQTESFAQKMADEQFRNQQQTYKMIDDSIARLGSAAFEGMNEAELGQLEKTAGLPKNYLMRQSQTLKKQEQEATRLASIKAAGSVGDTSSKIDKRVKEIIAMNPANGQLGGRNNVPNGVQWDTSAAQIDAELGAGTATKYDNYLKSVYAEGKAPVDSSIDTTKLQDKVNQVDSLLKDPGLAGAVGTTKLFRDWGVGSLTGNKQRFIAGIQNLVSQDILDTLIELKKAGGTLGAISEKELDLLTRASTQIGSWAMHDNPNDPLEITGYNIDEKSFTDELKKIKDSTQRILDAKSKNLFSSDENKVLNETFGGEVNPADFY